MTIPSNIPADIAERADVLCDQFRHIEDDREFVARILMALGQGGTHDVRAGLTPKQTTVLKFIEDCEEARAPAPSYDEIGLACDLSSKSQVHRIVHCLQQRGAIRLMPNQGRSIAIIRLPHVSTAYTPNFEVA